MNVTPIQQTALKHTSRDAGRARDSYRNGSKWNGYSAHCSLSDVRISGTGSSMLNCGRRYPDMLTRQVLLAVTSHITRQQKPILKSYSPSRLPLDRLEVDLDHRPYRCHREGRQQNPRGTPAQGPYGHGNLAPSREGACEREGHR